MRALISYFLSVIAVVSSANAQDAPPGSFNFGGSQGNECIAIEPGTGRCIRAGTFGIPEPVPGAPNAGTRPVLWLAGTVQTDREKAIFAKVRDRLAVAFVVKTDASAPPPPIGFQVVMFTLNGQIAVSMIHFAARPPVSLFRNIQVGICPTTGATDPCADLIVNTVYAGAPKWYDIPPYSGSGG